MRRLIALLLLAALPASAFAQDAATEFGLARANDPFALPSDGVAAFTPFLAASVAPELLSPLTLEARSLSAPKVEKPKKA